MSAALRDAPVLQYEYLVRAAHSGNALRNNDLCTGIGKLLKIFAQLLFGLQVDRRGGVVQDQDLRLLCQRAGQGDALLLAAGKPGALLADDGVEALGQRADEISGRETGVQGDVRT